MKTFIKEWLANFGLIVVCIYIISFLLYGNWNAVSFVLELFAVTLVIRLLQIPTNQFNTAYPILDYLLELALVIAVVLISGWLFKWYQSGNGLWLIVGMVVVVYGGAYVLDLTRTRQDIAYINEQIKHRRTANAEVNDGKE